jgi:formate hydrogenlyase transcriptional activator
MKKTKKTNDLMHHDDQRLLSLIAVFESDFSIDWLAGLTSYKITGILTILEDGVQNGWLGSREPGIYYLKDVKKRKKWIDLLNQREKNELHRKIADLFLAELPDDESKAIQLSYHLLLIQCDIEKCLWLLKAGDAYRKTYRTEKALQCYAKVLDDLEGLEGGEIDRIYTDAALRYSKISTAIQSTTKVISVINKAMSRAKKLNDKVLRSLLEMHMAKYEWMRSRYTSSFKHFETGWAMAREIDDPQLLRSVNTFIPHFFSWQGLFYEAIKVYEKFVPEVEKYPEGKFSLLSVLTVGTCYAHIGQVSQGLGLVDAIRAHCLETGDRHLAAHADLVIGAIMLEVNRTDDALLYLERAMKEGIREHNAWVYIMGRLMLAFGYYQKGDNEKSVAYLRNFLKVSSKVEVTVQSYPYLMELCWAMEQGKYPCESGLSIEKEVNRTKKGRNIFMKGVAYRYQALLYKHQEQPYNKIMTALNRSVEYLEDSGHQIELTLSMFEIARIKLNVGDKDGAAEITKKASEILLPFRGVHIPDDLSFLVKTPPVGEKLLKEILKLSQEMVTIHNNKDLVSNIISTVNRITGAERGAIFFFEISEENETTALKLRASKNLTAEQISDPGFSSSKRMIEEVASAGKGRILGMDRNDDSVSHFSEVIRSRICVPMILRDKVVGVLYHDNRLLASAFRESDLELLSYFAAQAAFALEVIKAYEKEQRLNEKLLEEKRYYEKEHLQNIHSEDIIGESKAVMRVLGQVKQVAAADTTVLVTGETGVGKELVARAIHRAGSRSDKPFIRVHCGALPESLITSELFGHERGAFTGAVDKRIGRFELADGGTLFLDEIGELTQDVQVRLLRVLQTKEFERVGGGETIHSDFRLVAATNRDLEQKVREKTFRSDLYYRLNVFPVHVPPLRERKDDINLLASHFLRNYASKIGKLFNVIPKTEIAKLTGHDWPGNVRELENIIEIGVILSSGPTFFVPELGVGSTEPVLQRENISLMENEKRHILFILEKTGWKVRGKNGAAELLEIHPSTLASRMKKLGIIRP